MSHLPVTHGRDFGNGPTLGKLVTELADLLDRGEIERFVSILDEQFIYGAWGGHLSSEDKWTEGQLKLLRADIRGLVCAAYRLGKARGSSELFRELAKAMK